VGELGNIDGGGAWEGSKGGFDIKSLESLLDVRGTITCGDIGGDRILGMLDIIFGGGFFEADEDKFCWKGIGCWMLDISCCALSSVALMFPILLLLLFMSVFNDGSGFVLGLNERF